MFTVSYRVDWSQTPNEPIRSYAIFDNRMDALRKCIALHNAGYCVSLYRCIYNTTTYTPITWVVWQSR